MFILFIVVAFSLYGALHYYVYRKLIILFPGRRRVVIGNLVVLASFVFLAELLTHNGHLGLAFPVALIAYSWMGVVFLFVFFSGLLDLVQFAAQRLGFTTLFRLLCAKQRNVVVSIGVVFISVFGFYSAKPIPVRTVDLTSAKLEQTLRVVQISDLHLGILTDAGRIATLVDIVNELNADVIVSTGDLVDMQLDHIQGMTEQLSSLKARLGKFAVLGNHEVYAGLDESVKVIEAAGFTILTNNSVAPLGLINLVGVDDPLVVGRFQEEAIKETVILAGLGNGLYTILLKHQPLIELSAVQYFDLQLSGHTHGGQIFPFGMLTKLVYPTDFGLSLISDDTWIYVSRGTGTWGPPMRILAAPEVTLFRIAPTSGTGS